MQNVQRGQSYRDRHISGCQEWRAWERGATVNGQESRSWGGSVFYGMYTTPQESC